VKPGQTYRDLRKAEELEKRSKNVRDKTRNITADQAEQRRTAYAHKIGLKPKHTVGPGGFDDTFDHNENSMPAARGRTIPYSGKFGVEHETAHAMMTPVGSTIRDHQRWLNAGDKAGERYGNWHHSNYTDGAARSKDPERDAEHHESAIAEENTARHVEHMLDRRAGVGAHRNEFRPGNDAHSQGVKGSPSPKDSLHVEYQHPKTHDDYEHDRESYRDSAAHHVNAFDLGQRKFNGHGRAIEGTSIHSRLNRKWTS
jgi:hypothetical protein